MALQISFSSDFGIDLSAAYARIESITIEQPLSSDAFLTVRIQIFADVAAKKAIRHPMAHVNLDATGELYVAFINACVNGADPVKVIYNHLKTLPLFSGAIDV